MFNSMNTKEHYKMYKKGKAWIFAGIFTATLALGTVDVTAHADTSDTSDVNQESVSTQSVEPAKEVTLSDATKGTVSESDADNEKADSNDTVSDETQTDDSVETESPVATAPEKEVPAEADSSTPTKTAKVKPDNDVTNESKGATGAEETDQPEESPKTPEERAAITPDKVVEGTKEKAPKISSQYLSRMAAAPAVMSTQAVPKADESIDQWMPNAKLQSEVLRTLNNLAPNGKQWASASDITQTDMLYLASLYNSVPTWIDENTPYSLEGLQYAKNLKTLSLVGLPQKGEGPVYAGITDISPLKGLENLTSLDLSFNSISDVSPIADLKNIKFLQLHYNHISDLSALDPAQYTEGFTYQNQQVTLPLVYVSNVTRSADLKFKAYLPGGKLVPLEEGNPGMFIEAYYKTPSTEIYWMVLRGGTGTPTEDGLKFTNLTNNGYVNLTEYNGVPIVPNQLAYYMVGKYYMDDGQNFIIVVQPYMIGNDAAPITARYVDEKGEVLKAESTINGVVGNQYRIDAPTIPGYELTTTPENATGTFSDKAQTVTFVYKAAMSTVTIHYQDESGSTIKDDTAVPGQIGTDFDIAHPDIPGYTYKETQGEAKGTYTENPTEITFVYTKNPDPVTPPVVTPDQTVTVTVHYQTADGTQVAPDVIITGKAGDTYTTSPAANVPAGYELTTTPANANGTFGDSDITVTYVYAKTGGDGDKVTPEPDKPAKKPNKPAKKPAATQSDKVVSQTGQGAKVTGDKVAMAVAKGGAAAKVDLAKSTAAPVAENPTTLPQTNERTTNTALWGLALLGGLLGLVGIKLKKRE